jgi:hypothetical protein
MARPRLTVYTPVYNGAKFLRSAIESILAQSFTDFEYLIVDDASTDETPQIIQDYADPRIISVRNEQNLGNHAAASRALSLARGELVARLDSDDVALPGRLERQIAHLDRHPDLGIVATWAKVIDESGREFDRVRTETDPALLAWTLTFRCLVVHSSVMLRREWFERMGGYDPALRRGADHDAWTRCLRRGERIGVIPEYLVQLRKHGRSVTAQNVDPQLRQLHLTGMKCYLDHLLGREIPLPVAEGLRALYRGEPFPEGVPFASVHRLTRDLIHACARLSPGQETRLRQLTCDQLIYGAQASLRHGQPRCARAALTDALRLLPARALRGSTLRLFFDTVVTPTPARTTAH